MVEFIRQGFRTFSDREGLGPAAWPHHDLLHVHRGVIALEFPEVSRSIELKAGMGVLIWPHTRFHGRVGEGDDARASIQHFRILSRATGVLARLRRQRAGFCVSANGPSEWSTACVNRLQQLATDTRADAREARCALLTLILAEGRYAETKGSVRGPRRIELAPLERWLRAHLGELPVVSDLARQVDLSPSRFRTVFLAEHGRTAGEFIQEVREAEAKRWLMETREPLKAIAAALGYADAVVFNRAFKHRTGVTPARYRRERQIVG